MNELESLKGDLLLMKQKLVDAISEYGENMEEQKIYIESLVSDAEKVELFSQIGNTLDKMNTVKAKIQPPKYF